MIYRAFCVALALTLTILAPRAPRAEEATTPAATAPAAGAPGTAVPDAAAPAAAAPATAAPAPAAAVPAPAAPGTASPTAAMPDAGKPGAAPSAAAASSPAAPGPSAPAKAAPDAATAGAAPAAPGAAAPVASTLNDVARLLAGLPLEATSPLAPLAANAEWRRHARSLDAAFGRVEKLQLSKIRTWSAHNLPQTRPTLLYFFSGPDFLYASAFFPQVKTYVLAGLEPPGPVPDPLKLKGRLSQGLGQIQASLSSILNYSFFRTIDMKTQLRSGHLDGTLPILYVFLERTGNTLVDVELVRVDREGAVAKDEGKAPAGATQGAKITFKSPDGDVKTLYYFSTNLANGGVDSSGFLKFCATLPPADAFIKSASYLLHDGNFSKVREFILENSTAIVQDDSGIPLHYFEPNLWELRPFGRYAGPISLFSGRYQSTYARLFKKSAPLDFGVGYRWRGYESNLLLAIRPPSAVQPQRRSGL